MWIEWFCLISSIPMPWLECTLHTCIVCRYGWAYRLLLFHALLYPNIWSFYCNSNDCIIVATPILWLHLALQLRKYSQLDTECLTIVILYFHTIGSVQAKVRHAYLQLNNADGNSVTPPFFVRFCTPYNVQQKLSHALFFIRYCIVLGVKRARYPPDQTKFKTCANLLCYTNIRTHRASTKSSAFQKLVGVLINCMTSFQKRVGLLINIS